MKVDQDDIISLYILHAAAQAMNFAAITFEEIERVCSLSGHALTDDDREEICKDGLIAFDPEYIKYRDALAANIKATKDLSLDMGMAKVRDFAIGCGQRIATNWLATKKGLN